MTMQLKDGFRTVSCAADPFNLRPALDVLQAEIESRTSQTPLVVMMSESHGSATHIALRQGLLGRLLNTTSSHALNTGYRAKDFRLAYGAESSFDTFKNIILTMGYKIPDFLQDRLNEVEGHDEMLLRVFRSVFDSASAPITHKSLLGFCIKSKISYWENDAQHSKKSGSMRYIDLTDERIIPLALRHMPSRVGEKINILDPDATTFRNRVIVDHAIRHIKHKQADIYVQDCGGAHLLGFEHYGSQYENSLTSLFQKAGFNVLPVFVTTPDFGMEIFPDGADEALRKWGVVIDGLSSEHFTRASPKRKELEFLKQIKAHSNDEIEIFPDLSLWPHIKELFALRRDIPEWIRNNCNAAPQP